MKDEESSNMYLDLRQKEIKRISIIFFIILLVSHIGFAISGIFVENSFRQAMLNWIFRPIVTIIHSLILYLLFKNPKKHQIYHGPLLVLLQSPNIIYNIDFFNEIQQLEAYMVGIIYLIFSFLVAILCNSKWILTSISMLLMTVSTLVYYSIVHHIRDYLPILLVSFILVVMIYATYLIEKREKLMCIHLSQIKQMNRELN